MRQVPVAVRQRESETLTHFRGAPKTTWLFGPRTQDAPLQEGANTNSFSKQPQSSYTEDVSNYQYQFAPWRLLRSFGKLMVNLIGVWFMVSVELVSVAVYVAVAIVHRSPLGGAVQSLVDNSNGRPRFDVLLQSWGTVALEWVLRPFGIASSTGSKNFQDRYNELMDQNILLACLHFCQAIASGAMLRGKEGTLTEGRVLTTPQTCWNHELDTTLQADGFSMEESDWTFYSVNVEGRTHVNSLIGWSIVGFFFLSSAFQVIISWRAVAFRDFLWFDAVQVNRYVEYTLSASLMIIATLAAFGITDEIILTFAFYITAGCMLAGLLADKFSHMDTQLRNVGFDSAAAITDNFSHMNMRRWAVGCHVLSWVYFAVVWNLLRWYLYTRTLLDGNTRDAQCNVPVDSSMWTLPADMTWALQLIFWGQLLFWAAFGVVQVRQFVKRGTLADLLPATAYRAELYKQGDHRWHTAVQAEQSFVWLSIGAKTILAWLLLTRVLVRN
jgi:hypothetical protein